VEKDFLDSLMTYSDAQVSSKDVLYLYLSENGPFMGDLEVLRGLMSELYTYQENFSFTEVSNEDSMKRDLVSLIKEAKISLRETNGIYTVEKLE
jgi:hypothetical protein